MKTNLSNTLIEKSKNLQEKRMNLHTFLMKKLQNATQVNFDSTYNDIEEIIDQFGGFFTKIPDSDMVLNAIDKYIFGLFSVVKEQTNLIYIFLKETLSDYMEDINSFEEYLISLDNFTSHTRLGYEFNRLLALFALWGGSMIEGNDVLREMIPVSTYKDIVDAINLEVNN